MPTKTIPVLADDVMFRFLGSDEDSLLRGSVLVRDGEIVLDIPGGYGPYLIVGKPRLHWYEGTNSATARRFEVSATWANVGESYVGRWIEANHEYLFSFVLGSSTT